jgi:hypothetical protein
MIVALVLGRGERSGVRRRRHEQYVSSPVNHDRRRLGTYWRERG